jgi:SAM-dependent methyltransferase
MLNYNQYYSSRAGQVVIKALNQRLRLELSKIFGYYAIEMGQHLQHTSWLQHSRIKNNIAIYSQQQLKDEIFQTSVLHKKKIHRLKLISEPEFLPITFDNTDLIISSHLLEYSHYPQQILREIDRVLTPDGHCFLIGFNPFNYIELAQLGLDRLENYKKSPYQKAYHAYSSRKISDWLNVLCFEIISIHSYGYRPNIANSQLFKALQCLDSIGSYFAKYSGQVYLIHARKTKFSAITTQRWQSHRFITHKPVIAVTSEARK